MNKRHVKHCIKLMRDAEKHNALWMLSWQETASSGIVAMNFKELHACGNTACLAGHIALSPLFKKLEGKVDQAQFCSSGANGKPVLPLKVPHKSGLRIVTGSKAVAKFLGIDVRLAQLMCLRYEKPDPKLVGAARHILYGCRFEHVQPYHVITVLEDLLDGKFGVQKFTLYVPRPTTPHPDELQPAGEVLGYLDSLGYKPRQLQEQE